MNNAGIDLAGRCLSCGHHTESTAGCTPCWQRRMSEAASTVLTMAEVQVFTVDLSEVRQSVFAKLLAS